MKANELMIGDWVQHPDGEGRILILAMDGLYLEDKEGRCYACSYDKILPIPLTPEILEKNGFVFFDDSYNKKPIRRYKYEGDGYKCGISVNDTDGYYFTFGIPYNGIYFNIVRALRVRSVHELQHALRLCGADLDIVI